MKELLLSVAVLLTSACNRGLADREAELAALRKDEAHLAAQLNLLTKNLTSLQVATKAEQTRATVAASSLHVDQQEAVARWKGEAAKLEPLAKTSGLTPTLRAALELAQSVAGGETVEKRFVRAVAANDVTSVDSLARWWELKWLAVNAPEPEVAEAEPKVCPTTRTLGCIRIDDDSLWCPDAQEHASWALVLDNGTLEVDRLGAGEFHTVDARLAPRVWLTRFGSPDNGALYLHVLRNGDFRTQWQARLSTDEGGRLEQLKANFDEDPFTEALFWTKQDLLFADPSGKDELTLLRDVQACDALDLLEGVPAPVRERCRALRLKSAPVAADAGR